ncbi:TetR/AcrR family transcriptional regulator [Spirosoma koreense]
MEESRQHILQTALTLFLEKSYKAVTFQELMEKTGFSKGAFFHYFKNKQQIFEAAIDLYIERFATVEFTQLSQTSLREFLDAYFQEARKVRDTILTPELMFGANHYSLLFEAMRIVPDFKTKINRHEAKALAAWMNIIAAARTSGEIKTTLPDEQLARLFIDTSHGLVIHLIMTDNTTAFEAKVSAAWNSIYGLIEE